MCPGLTPSQGGGRGCSAIIFLGRLWNGRPLCATSARPSLLGACVPICEVGLMADAMEEGVGEVWSVPLHTQDSLL